MVIAIQLKSAFVKCIIILLTGMFGWLRNSIYFRTRNDDNKTYKNN
ncbi:MAG: hypothetical protein JWR61_3885 [Ferruginibacter sp.]|nr:hypothetical protein [Ferruginibacter sp.]